MSFNPLRSSYLSPCTTTSIMTSSARARTCNLGSPPSHPTMTPTVADLACSTACLELRGPETLARRSTQSTSVRMGCPGEAIQGHKSRQWTARRERERGGGERSNEAVAMLPRGGWVADDKTRGGGAEGVAQGELEADDWTRGEGRTMRGKWAADDRSSQQEGGGARRSQRRQWR